MNILDKWTSYCQKELNNKNWFPWFFKSVPGGILCVGAECPKFLIGKNKGKPNFKKKNKDTIKNMIIPKQHL